MQPRGLPARGNGIEVVERGGAEVVDGGLLVAACRLLEDGLADDLGKDVPDALEEVEQLVLGAVLAHDERVDGEVREGRRVDEVLRWHVVAVVLRVGQAAALRVALGQVVADARAAIRAVLRGGLGHMSRERSGVCLGEVREEGREEKGESTALTSREMLRKPGVMDLPRSPSGSCCSTLYLPRITSAPPQTLRLFRTEPDPAP